MESSNAPMQTVVQCTLPASHSLVSSSACPTRDLLALPSSSDSKLALWRIAREADIVWDVSAIGVPSVTSAKVSFLKGKAKESASGKIQALAWSPNGSHVAVVQTSSSGSSSSLLPLSVHNGISPIPPIVIPNSTPITHLSWHTLRQESRANQECFARRVIAVIPSLPQIPVDPVLSSIGAGVAGSSGSTSGVFGAKNAMLQREREKEAGRPVDFNISAKGFPALLIESEEPTETPDTEEHKKKDTTLLVIGDSDGKLHLYLHGSMYIGSYQLIPGAKVESVILQESANGNDCPCITVLQRLQDASKNSVSFVSSICSLRLPVTLEIFGQQIGLLRNSILHAFETLQRSKILWEESRRIGKAWLTRLSDLSKSHGVTQSPVTQLLLLLTTGRPSRSLHDFLASKMNEKAFSKWETTTSQALDQLKKCTFMSIEPAMEHSILLLDELKAWAMWPEKKFKDYQLNVDQLARCVEVSKETIRSASTLERHTLEEERCFKSFCSWMHYELEKLAQQEGSDIRPLARFQPIPVAHYIRHCLPESILNRYLSFGLAVNPLENNSEVNAGSAWFNSMDPNRDTVMDLGPKLGVVDPDESLSAMMKRLKEELKGQADAEILLTKMQVATEETPSRSERLPRPVSPSKSQAVINAPQSLPVLLHLLGEKSSKLCRQAMESLIEGVRLEDRLSIGSSNNDCTSIKQRVVAQKGQRTLFAIWQDKDSMYFSRQALSSKDAAGSRTLRMPLVFDVATLSVISYDILNDKEVVFAFRKDSSEGLQYLLTTIEYTALDYSEGVGPVTVPIRFTRTHALSSHFPPESMALSGTAGKYLACLLAGEGRRLEVFDLNEPGKKEDEARMEAEDG